MTRDEAVAESARLGARRSARPRATFSVVSAGQEESGGVDRRAGFVARGRLRSARRASRPGCDAGSSLRTRGRTCLVEAKPVSSGHRLGGARRRPRPAPPPARLSATKPEKRVVLRRLGSSVSVGGSCSAIQPATIRSSSISSAGIGARPGGRDSAASVRSTSSERARQRAPVDQPALDDPERVEALLHRVPRQHQPRRGVGGAQHAVEPLEHPRQPVAPAQQRRGALEALASADASRIRAVDLLDQCLARARRLEMRERHVELAAVGVRVEVAEAGRHAAAHLPVRRRVLAHLQLAPAVAQPVERRELVGQLAPPARGCRAARRSRRAPAPARPPPRAPG